MTPWYIVNKEQKYNTKKIKFIHLKLGILPRKNYLSAINQSSF
jgi:hypothetical protein